MLRDAVYVSSAANWRISLASWQRLPIDPRAFLETMGPSMSGLPRSSGVLLHPASLPGRFGMGELGAEALRWLDTLKSMAQSFWLLPPLHGASSFAGEPLLLSFDSLRMDGVLLTEDLALLPGFDHDRIALAPVAEVRGAFLRLAARRCIDQGARSPLLRHAFDAFCDREADWLDDWAMFAALSQHCETSDWSTWPSPLSQRDPAAIAEAMVQHASEIEEHKALQFLYSRQWHRLRAHAHSLGISVIGTLPSVPAPTSADAWAAQELFVFAKQELAFDLAALRTQDFIWWRARIDKAMRSYDALRIIGPVDEALVPVLQGVARQGCTLLGSACQTDITMAANATDVADSEEWQGDAPLVAFDWREALDASSDPATWRFGWEHVTPELLARLHIRSGAGGRV